MNLTLIGAGGLRTPMFTLAAARWAKRIGLERLTLMDVDEKRLGPVADLCGMLVRQMGAPLRLVHTTDPAKAIKGADFVVLSIRVGNERGRIADERVAIENGAIGQETTGPGGFAMSLRSIPAALGYAGLTSRLAPNAWIVNFTNPAGLVTQAMRDAGFERTVGICDSADHLRRNAGQYLGLDRSRFDTKVFGLNHLSFAQALTLDGKDLMGRMLADGAFIRKYYGLFDPKWIRRTRLFPNEYLHYYFDRDEAFIEMREEKLTRGEKILDLNKRFFRGYASLAKSAKRNQTPELYASIMGRRHESYMEGAWKQAGTERPEFAAQEEEEGYAGVALSLMQALSGGKSRKMVLSVPCAGHIPGLSVHDVAEVSCMVHKDKIVPDQFDSPNPEALRIVQDVKVFETLTVQAARTKNTEHALRALAAHPLVPFHSMAQKILAGYMKAHRQHLKGWK